MAAQRSPPLETETHPEIQFCPLEAAAGIGRVLSRRGCRPSQNPFYPSLHIFLFATSSLSSRRPKPKRARFGPKRPFWGPSRSSEGPGGPDLVPTAPKWSDAVKLMVTTHFDLISGPLRVPRGPKGVILAQSLNFHVPIFWGILFVSNIGLWGVQSVAAECLAHSALL